MFRRFHSLGRASSRAANCQWTFSKPCVYMGSKRCMTIDIFKKQTQQDVLSAAVDKELQFLESGLTQATMTPQEIKTRYEGLLDVQLRPTRQTDPVITGYMVQNVEKTFKSFRAHNIPDTDTYKRMISLYKKAKLPKKMFMFFSDMLSNHQPDMKIFESVLNTMVQADEQRAVSLLFSQMKLVELEDPTKFHEIAVGHYIASGDIETALSMFAGVVEEMTPMAPPETVVSCLVERPVAKVPYPTTYTYNTPP